VFFDDWGGLVRVLVVGLCAYLAFLALLRISGKRTLAELNAFDFVITVVLGSTLATVLLSADVALAEAVSAMALLVAMQFLVACLSVRSRTVERLVKSEPTLVYRHGLLHGPMQQMRVTEDEIRQAARTAGNAGLDGVAAVVLETDGSLGFRWRNVVRGDCGDAASGRLSDLVREPR
jgi:uncharacterized membrane protein YcaP (DUF421 family)